ncbi:MAG TPA: hypothetical protein VFR18_00925, partial [Terriglobia bacterium]|nr:hypothetical protein [Terriglobia bacterium]
LVFWSVITAALGLRVSQDEEIEGLDMGEHGMEAYAGFQMSTSDYSAMTAAVANNPAGAFAKAKPLQSKS